jgi:hypothetical protein
VSDVCPSVPRRHKDLDRLTDQIVAGVTGHLHEEFVYVADDSVFVDKCDPVREHVKQVKPRDNSIIQMVHDVSTRLFGSEDLVRFAIGRFSSQGRVSARWRWTISD